MNKIPEIIKQSKLLNRLVLDRATVEEQGRVEKLWLNAGASRVMGITCKSGLFGKNKNNFVWEQIDTIGADAMLVNKSPDGRNSEKPEEIVSAIANEVWTDAGNKVGWLSDYLLNTKTGAVVNYLFKSSGWRGVLDGIYLLPSEAVRSAGNKRIIVSDAAVQSLELYAKGINHKFSRAAEFLQEDLKKTREHLKGMRQGSKQLAGEFQEQAREVKAKAQQKAGEIQEKAQLLAENAQQKAGELKQKAPERSPELPEGNRPKASRKLPEKTNEFQNQIQEVTEKARIRIDEVTTQWQNHANSEGNREEKTQEQLPQQP